MASGTATKEFDNLYNDDYGGTYNSQITKIFEAKVPYLIIVSPYNISLSSSVGEFSIYFD